MNFTLSDEEINDIKLLFNLYDQKGTGIIYPQEFKDNMELIGLHEKEPMLYSFINELNTEEANKNGITVDDFINFINYKLGDKNNKEGIRRIFELFVNKKGDEVIQLHTFKKIANEYGKKLNNEQIKELFEKSTSDGNSMTFEEFYKLFNK